jgi:uncharacterized spore protein YtfJ
MNIDQFIATARESMTVRRVYGDPYEKDGVTVIPSARVSGGAGGGGGHDEQGQEGEGGGFGVQARPAGAYVIKDGQVRWMPAVDVNRVMSILGAVLIALFVTRTRIVRMRTRAARGSK